MLEESAQDRLYSVEFSGRGSEYFRIWIVNILLTICTLYIYSAWAKVRSKRYFYGNTFLDGSSFEYHAQGKQLLPGRLIGLVLIAVIALGEYLSAWVVGAAYLILLVITPWALCRSSMFNARMSSYRNIRFGFNGKARLFYQYLLLTPVIVLAFSAAIGVGLMLAGIIERQELILTLPIAIFCAYLLWPWIQCRVTAYSIDHTKFGVAGFDTQLSAGRFYRTYIVGLIIFLITFLIIGGIAAFVFYMLTLNGTVEFEPTPEFMESAASIPLIAGVYLVMILVGYVAAAYVKSRLRNYQYNRTLLDGKFQMSSSIRMWPLWWLGISNLVLIVFTLGLGYPWAAVRKARFMAKHTHVVSAHSTDHFVEQQHQAVSAMGEEIGDAFDLDLAIGI